MKFLSSLLSLALVSTMAFSYSGDKVFDKIGKDLDAMVVKDLNTKEIVYSKDPNQAVRPASLTKIMTAIIAIESGRMNNIVTITPEMKNVQPTILNFKVGEKFYLKDLVSAALIKSANDAANAIAIYLGNGDKENFVDIMNWKAKKIGMMNTNFENPCGFDSKNHKTTANDLLKLTEYAIRSNTFNSIVKLNSYAFASVNTKKIYRVHTSNKLMDREKYIIGVKTGFTNQAGPCLIARAKKNDKDVLLVMLNAGNRWENAKLSLNTVLKN